MRKMVHDIREATPFFQSVPVLTSDPSAQSVQTVANVAVDPTLEATSVTGVHQASTDTLTVSVSTWLLHSLEA